MIMQRRSRGALTAVAAVMLAALVPGIALAQAPILGAGKPGAIEGRYIVVLKSDASAASADRARRTATARGGRVSHDYGQALKGFTVTLPAQALEDVRNDPAVAYVEPDAVVSIASTQTGAPWNLDRIDQRGLPVDGSYTYVRTGAGVTAYIIDTGIRTTHTQFGGRATSGFDAVDGGTADDCNGHGTHVAGTVGGSTYGVAKEVGLVAVRVLDCSGGGSTSAVIAGIDFVTGAHVPGQPAVANMSLGGGPSTAMDQAVQRSIADGVSYAIAAGNDNRPACSYSPARVASALTVGSTTSTDARSSFSNYGSCLDLFAPGSSVLSPWYTSNTATNTISGTSMAAPHVAGAAALVLQGAPSAAPADVASAVNGAATTDRVTNPGSGSSNRLLYSFIGVAPPPPPPPPLPTGCGLAESFSGTLSGTGDSDVQPGGTSYVTASSGIHRGCLTGPSNADFDLYLDKRRGTSWVPVASGVGTTSTENVSYNGTPGEYRWRVHAYRGAGSYLFGLTKP